MSRRLLLLLKGVAPNFNQINIYQLLKDIIVWPHVNQSLS